MNQLLAFGGWRLAISNCRMAIGYWLLVKNRKSSEFHLRLINLTNTIAMMAPTVAVNSEPSNGD